MNPFNPTCTSIGCVCCTMTVSIKETTFVGGVGEAPGHVTMEASSKKTCPKTTTKSTPGSIHTDPFYRDGTIMRLLAMIH